MLRKQSLGRHFFLVLWHVTTLKYEKCLPHNKNGDVAPYFKKFKKDIFGLFRSLVCTRIHISFSTHQIQWSVCVCVSLGVKAQRKDFRACQVSSVRLGFFIGEWKCKRGLGYYCKSREGKKDYKLLPVLLYHIPVPV